MKKYLVTWTIDIEDVNSPEEAAQLAFKIMQEKGTEATVFFIKDKESGETTEVDVQNNLD